MIKAEFSSHTRELKIEEITSDLVIVGGGMAGTCCAILAARKGLKVTLVQDRPVLGGNASSEIRLWILGATSHMGNNNRWAREGGVIDEILVENLYRNPEGNPLILDTILIEKVTAEPNIRLLLNTAAYEAEKSGDHTIKLVWAFCSQNSTRYKLISPLFADGTGDGVLGFLSGASFRIGAESKDEFDEQFAPDHQFGELLGHSLYFYSKDTGKPVRFVAPSYTLKTLDQLPRFKSFNLKQHGCWLWWVEYGGRMDTIHESEKIKWELWKVIYGIWHHIKNSGEFPDMETHTLEWVGTIPGKRESRRFEGDFMLSQRDVVEQREHYDAISYGGWALDLHPAEGVYGEKPGCTQWHSKGVYQIPYRTMYSKNISNLFFLGRIISASHVAFGSSRVMATCAHNAQAVAMAAVMCKIKGLLPKELAKPEWIKVLQQKLLAEGHYIPKIGLKDPEELAAKAEIRVSSTLSLKDLPFDGPWKKLEFQMAQLLPVPKGKVPRIKVQVKAKAATELHAKLMVAIKRENFTPEVVLAEQKISLQAGTQFCEMDFNAEQQEDSYLFAAFMANEDIELKYSNTRITGLLSLHQKFNKSVAVSSRQEPPKGIGIDSFDFWLPERRPQGHNLAFSLSHPLQVYEKDALTNGVFRPTLQPNAWVADPSHNQNWVELKWDKKQKISRLRLFFDTDFDHALESTLLGHPESEIPFCVKRFKVCDGKGNSITEVEDNHQTIHTIDFPEPLETDSLKIRINHPHSNIPAALFGITCHSSNGESL
ncbi:FAD-dependent oxidoreductase [Pleomorphovibrio marinus]|uniref:FAD-dependent oxidoreductase n=1 Tax=Pleomorphovibrio marinus TaxID=2164132 RepID=UPI000E0A2D93|nr:FAD-dependent oxidoreductase [Pleomorphovibrio marinus]